MHAAPSLHWDPITLSPLSGVTAPEPFCCPLKLVDQLWLTPAAQKSRKQAVVIHCSKRKIPQKCTFPPHFQSQTLRMSKCHLRTCTPSVWTEPWACWWFGLNSRDMSQLSPLSWGQMRNIQAPDYSKLEGSTYSSFLLSKTTSSHFPTVIMHSETNSDTLFTSPV